MPRQPRNIFTGGSATQGVAPGGGRNNRGPGTNRGGGPGRKKGIPEGGLFHGKAGEAAANAAPDAFFRGALRGSGLTTGRGDPRDVFSQDTLLNDLLGQYELANQANQKLSAEDWMKNTYGASWAGKRGQNFQAGTLASLGGDIEDRFQDWTSNQEPLTAASNAMRNQGFLASNANPDLANFVNTVLPGMFEQEWHNRQMAGESSLSMADFMAQQDPDRIRRLYATRAPAYRQPSAARPMGGAWSWWG
jgi:hypothetical protein